MVLSSSVGLRRPLASRFQHSVHMGNNLISFSSPGLSRILLGENGVNSYVGLRLPLASRVQHSGDMGNNPIGFLSPGLSRILLGENGVKFVCRATSSASVKIPAFRTHG
jgi:hypothetical protein